MKPIAKKLGIIGASVFIVTLSFFAGLYVNAEQSIIIERGDVSPQFTATPTGVDLSSFWRVWSLINARYTATGVAATTTVTDRDKIYGAIKGLTNSLGDPYTVFLTPEEAKSLTSDLSGSLEGIGAVLSLKNDVVTVVSVIKSSPAQKAGLMPGDQILKVDGTDTAGLSIDKVVSLIRGAKGTTVNIILKKQSSTTTSSFSIIRDTINVPIVETKSYPNGVFGIKVSSFTSNAPELFRNALKEFVNSGDTKLILDLRNNTGGYLDASIDMASWFLPAGKTVVTEDYGKKADPAVYRSKGYNLALNNLKIVILANESTASASEILAGALKDNGKAVIVGEKTYGKGSVQELIPVTNDSILKVTVARWLTPNGNSISLNGIKPDYEVKLTEDDFKNDRDPQLNKALEVIKNL